MSLFFSPTETTVGSRIIPHTLINKIAEFIVATDLDEHNTLGFTGNDKVSPVFITGYNSKEDEIPLFNHPVRVEVRNKTYLASDLRQCLTATLAVKNSVEYSYVLSRAVLSMEWLTDKGVSGMRNSLGYAGAVFGAWLSDTVSKRYMLDPRDQSILMIIGLYYYYSLFYRENMTKDEIDIVGMKISNFYKLPSTFTYENLDKLTPIMNINDLCNTISRILENPRLDNLNSGTLITILGNTWYSANAPELVAVGLEHPPTWIGLVYAATVEKTYKTSILSKIAERYSKNNQGANFVAEYNNILDKYKP
jgi:hypothetical protein